MAVVFRDAVGHPSSTQGGVVAGAAQAGWTVTSVASTNDEAGTIATTAASSTAAGNAVVVTFANAYPAVPKAVLVTGPLGAYSTSVTAAGFTITTSSTSSATNNTAYSFAYNVCP
jgi:hypothetical protein